uniref:ZZ-type domain-containing protein n=1 Tax=Meloidogyne hapla TaxID=6305 RepID=A0A1I8BDI1_MELHA
MKQPNNYFDILHKNIYCDGCHKEIRGRRYKCLICPDFDLCHLCEQKNEHFGHAMMRLVTPTTLLPDFLKARFENQQVQQANTSQNASTSQQSNSSQKRSGRKPKKKVTPKKSTPKVISKKIISKTIPKKITPKKIAPNKSSSRTSQRSNIKEEPNSDTV